MVSGFGYIPVTRLPAIPAPPPPAPEVAASGGPGPATGGRAPFQESLEHSGAQRGNESRSSHESRSPTATGAAGGPTRIQTPGVEAFRLERTTQATRIDRDARALRGESHSLRNLPSRWENFRIKVHDVLQQSGGASQQDLFLLQLEMNEISFQVETASKVVEHATSGTKTILQTQA